MGNNITIQNIYTKLVNLEEHITAIEHTLLPQMKVSRSLSRRLETARKEMRSGESVKLSALK